MALTFFSQNFTITQSIYVDFLPLIMSALLETTDLKLLDILVVEMCFFLLSGCTFSFFSQPYYLVSDVG